MTCRIAPQVKSLWCCWSHPKYLGIFLQEHSLKVVLDGVPQGSVLWPTVFLFFINDLPDEVLSRIGIYADDTTLYPVLVSLFFWEGGISWWTWVSSIVACGTKTKRLSFNCHGDPPLVPVEMNGIELPEETSFHLLGLTFTRSMDWKPYVQVVTKAASWKVGSLYRAHHFLTPVSV